MNIGVGIDTGDYIFDATGKTVTFLGLDTNINQIKMIVNSTHQTIIYLFADSKLGGSLVGNILSLSYTGDTSSMSDSDDLMIVFDIGEPHIDFGLGLVKTQEQSPLWTRRISPESLATAQNMTVSWADIGSVIDMWGYKKLGVLINVDANDSLDGYIRAVGEFSFDGTDNADMDNGELQLWSSGSTDNSYYRSFDAQGSPYLKLQGKVGTVGAVAADYTVSIIKIY